MFLKRTMKRVRRSRVDVAVESEEEHSKKHSKKHSKAPIKDPLGWSNDGVHGSEERSQGCRECSKEHSKELPKEQSNINSKKWFKERSKHKSIWSHIVRPKERSLVEMKDVIVMRECSLGSRSVSPLGFESKSNSDVRNNINGNSMNNDGNMSYKYDNNPNGSSFNTANNTNNKSNINISNISGNNNNNNNNNNNSNNNSNNNNNNNTTYITNNILSIESCCSVNDSRRNASTSMHSVHSLINSMSNSRNTSMNNSVSNTRNSSFIINGKSHFDTRLLNVLI